MSDAAILITQPASSSTKLDAEQVTVGGQAVLRERMEISGSAADDIAKVIDQPPANTDHGLVARLLAENPSSPLYTRSSHPGTKKIVVTSQATVAAGGEATLDSTQIATNKTATLVAIIVTSSVPFKAQLRSVVDNIVTLDACVWVSYDGGWDFRPPAGFITVAHTPTAGLDCFRVVVKNLEVADPADIYATFMYTEE